MYMDFNETAHSSNTNTFIINKDFERVIFFLNFNGTSEKEKENFTTKSSCDFLPHSGVRSHKGWGKKSQSTIT